VSAHWLAQFGTALEESAEESRFTWNFFRAWWREHDADVFENSEVFGETSLLFDTWVHLLLEQLKLPKTKRLTDDDMMEIRAFLAGYSARRSDDLETINQLVQRSDELFHRAELIRSECIMNLFGTQPAAEYSNERNLIVTRALNLFRTTRDSYPGDDDVDRGDTTSSGVSSRKSVVGIIRHVRDTYGIRLLYPQSFLDSPDGSLYPTFGMRVPGVLRPYTGCLRPLPEEGTEDTLLDTLQLALADYSHEHLVTDFLHAFYCMTLVHRDEGFDEQIPDYYRWLQHQLEDPITNLVSSLHKRTRMAEESFQAVVEDLLFSMPDPESPAYQPADADELDNAIRSLFTATDWTTLAAGDYDFVRVLASYARQVPHARNSHHFQLAQLL
jgi:hypothetical protein